MFKPKDVKIVKDILRFLNKEFPRKDRNNFVAYYDKKGIPIWHIICGDHYLWEKKEELRFYEKIIKIKYPDLRFIIPYCHNITQRIMKDRKGVIFIQ